MSRGCLTVEAIGQALKAGTNCGSCRSEIREVLDGHRRGAKERHEEVVPMQAGERV